jgi:putative flippase GtrA
MKIPEARAALFDGRLVVRHQIAAFATTIADFTVMVLLVELAMLLPPIATVLSAILGGAFNFSVSRVWAYRRQHRGGLGSQARRYAATSLGGALLNGMLLALVLAAVKLPYPIARTLVAFAVSLFYTYPMHARFVFRLEP